MVQGKSKDLIDHHQVKSWKYWSVSQYPSWSSILPPVLRLCHRLWCFMTARWWGSCIFKQECIKMKMFICTIQKTISVPCGLWKAIEASLGIHLCLSHKHSACNLIVFRQHNIMPACCVLCQHQYLIITSIINHQSSPVIMDTVVRFSDSLALPLAAKTSEHALHCI